MLRVILSASLVLLWIASGHATERVIANQKGLMAVAGDDFACAETTAISVRAPNADAFTGDRIDLQRLLAGVRIALGFECPALVSLIINGETDGKQVYRGIYAKDTGWTLVNLSVPQSPSDVTLESAKSGATQDARTPDAQSEETQGGTTTNLATGSSGQPPPVPVSRPKPALTDPSRLIGLWRGEYVCGQGKTGLDLEFNRDAVANEMRVVWTFYPLTNASKAATGAFEARVVSMSEPATFRLVPVRWLRQPRGYQSVATIIRLGADGKSLSGSIDTKGCDSLSAGKVETASSDSVAPNAPLVAPARPDSDIANWTQGNWLASFACGEDRYISKLVMPAFRSASEKGTFDYYSRDEVGAGQKMGLVLNLDPTNQSISSTIGQRLRLQNSPPLFPETLVADLENDQMKGKIGTAGCEEVLFRRENLPPPVSIVPVPLTPSQDTIFARDTRSVSRVHLAAAPAACNALKLWSEQISEQEKRRISINTWTTDWGKYPNLFFGERFTRFFGLSYKDLSSSTDVGNTIVNLTRKTCRRQLGVDIVDHTSVLRVAFSPKRRSFGDTHDRFKYAIEDLKDAVAYKESLNGRIASVPETTNGLAELDRLQKESEAKLASLLEADRGDVSAKIATRRRQIQNVVDREFLARIFDPNLDISFSDLERMDDLAREAMEPERSRALTAIDDRLATLSQEQFLSRLDGLTIDQFPGFEDQVIQRLQQFGSYESVRTVRARIVKRRTELTEAFAAGFNARIADAETVSDLRQLKRDLSESAKNQAVAKLIAPVWTSYDDRAKTVLARLVQEIPEPVSNTIGSGAATSATVEKAPAEQPARKANPLGGFALKNSTTPAGNKNAAPETRLVGLHRKNTVQALLTSDRTALYRLPRGQTRFYLKELVTYFKAACPAVLPPNITSLIVSQFTDQRLLYGGRDGAAAVGLEALLKDLQTLQNPGQAIQNAARADELRTNATADAQILLSNFGCPHNELRTAFNNVKQYYIDPAAGVPFENFTMGDICYAGLSDGSGDRRTRKYCNCASEEIERGASPDLKTYIRHSPKTHFRHLYVLDRNLSSRLRRCQQ